MRELRRDRYRSWLPLREVWRSGLDYCIADADTASDMTASTTMAAPTCALPWWTSLAPYMSATTWRLACASTTPIEPKDLNNGSMMSRLDVEAELAIL